VLLSGAGVFGVLLFSTVVVGDSDSPIIREVRDYQHEFAAT